MTNHYQTRRALTTSALALLLCVVMLVGTTFAWFTDSASTAVNTIQAGTLKIDVLKSVDDGNTWTELGKTPLSFLRSNAQGVKAEAANILWEPGCTYELPQLKIVNNGTLALKYKVLITGIQGDAELNDVIDWTMALDGRDFTVGSEHTLLAQNDAQVLTIKGHMQETASNFYQGKSIEGISITVVATQYTHEYDSNSNRYDENAQYPVDVKPVIVEEGKVTQDVTLASSEKVPGTATPLVEATVPADAAAEDDAESLALHYYETEEPANFTVKADDAAKTLEVKVEGLAESNTVPVLVKLAVEPNLRSFKLYHNGIEMTAVASREAVLNDQEYYYDSEAGIVYLASATFSPFTYTYSNRWTDYAASAYATAVDTVKKTVTIASAEELALFAKEVNAGNAYAGYTVTLTQDADLLSRLWTPINGFTGTFDGGNHTVANLNVNGGTDGKGFGLFGASNAQAYKNLKLHNVQVTGNSALGALVGNMFTGTVDNVHVSGDILIGISTKNGHIANYNSSYAGGIVGHGYAKISNCSVKGNDGSVIGHGRQVGGIYGFSGEGRFTPVANCTVENVKIIGTRCIGGILGWAHYGNIVKNCTVKDVDLVVTGWEKNTIGAITGTTYAASGKNQYNEFIDNTASGCTFSVGGKTLTPEAPYSLYATYGNGECYIKRGDNTYIYCSVAQAETLKQDGDIVVNFG